MTSDSWTHLKKFTGARIALGRTGGSLPTMERLHFQLAQAQARDAATWPFDAGELAKRLAHLPPGALALETCARDRVTYLRRPDLGRRLTDSSRAALAAMRAQGPWDLVIMVSDGLSALAALNQAPSLLDRLWPPLMSAGWRLAPLMVMANARVAVQDEIGEGLKAEMGLILLGERPGLGSPDSLGAYMTFRPAPGKTDADRNCVSNIRPEGLPIALAAEKIIYLLNESRRLGSSGVALKDNAALAGMPPANRQAEMRLPT